ncbi:hypothetical protein SADUNF_Sadunf05G0189000 [Salix dunnii]|uniref:Uncharacterized protein n=1 Tax=Salix dunnii TaxID=1413687 RepID=A0A835MZT5_9ROSI|nr:hypothetical protein SADUNF_Sadunf05G0189000 [Salix dunnii]
MEAQVIKDNLNSNPANVRLTNSLGTVPAGAKQPSRKPHVERSKASTAQDYEKCWLASFSKHHHVVFCFLWADAEQLKLLDALQEYHAHDTSKLRLGLTSLFVVTSCLSSFQIYATPVPDNLEIRYTSKIKKPCTRWLRTVLRDLLWMLNFFISAALLS